MAGVDAVMAKIDPSKPSFRSRQVRETRLFFRDLRPRARGPLRVVCGGMERCSPEYRIDRPGFRFPALEFVREGRAVALWRGREVPLGPGSVLAYGPQVPHRIVADAQRPPVKYFVDFTGRDAGALLAPMLESGPAACARPEVVWMLFEELIRAGAAAGRAADERCAAVLRALLLTLADDLRPAARLGTAAGRRTYLRAREQLERRGLEFRTLGDLARAVGVGAPYLCRLFQAEGAESPWRAIRRVHFARAAECLLRPDLRVKDAAAAIGMADPYQFSRAFKRVYGVSPQAFKRYRGAPGVPE